MIDCVVIYIIDRNFNTMLNSIKHAKIRWTCFEPRFNNESAISLDLDLGPEHLDPQIRIQISILTIKMDMNSGLEATHCHPYI